MVIEQNKEKNLNKKMENLSKNESWWDIWSTADELQFLKSIPEIVEEWEKRGVNKLVSIELILDGYLKAFPRWKSGQNVDRKKILNQVFEMRYKKKPMSSTDEE